MQQKIIYKISIKFHNHLLNNLDFEEWIDIYLKMVNWDIELDLHSEIGLRQTLNDQKTGSK